MGAELCHATDITWCHWHDRGDGVCHTGGVCHGKLPVEILDQYFSVIVTIPHISIKTETLCIPTYFSVYLKPWEVIIMHKLHKYLKTKTFLSSRWWCPWCHTIMAGTQSNFWILAHFYQDLCNSCIKSEARTEFSGLFYIYTKISSFQTGLLYGLHL